MTIEEYVKTLDPNHSYWLADDGDTKRLNDVEPTAENLCIVFACYNCTRLYHAIPYTDLKIDNDGDYLVFCPENKEGGYEKWIFRCNVPEELQTLFDKADLETYVDPEDEDEDEDEDDYDEDADEDEEDDCDEEGTPAERIIKSGAGGVIRA